MRVIQVNQLLGTAIATVVGVEPYVSGMDLIQKFSGGWI